MKCRGARKHIQSLVTGELDRTTAESVLKHIESCTDCAEEKMIYERLIADLSTPRPMADLPAGLEELRAPDRQSRRMPVLRLAIGALGVLAFMAVLLVSAYRQPVQPPLAPAPQREVTGAEGPPVVAVRTPAPVPVRQTEHKAAVVVKAVVCRNIVVRRRAFAKQRPTPGQQTQVSRPDASQPRADLVNMAQVPEGPSIIDIDITDHTTGRTYIERRVGVGPVCSLIN